MTKQFEYEKQTFQEECVQNIISIFGYLHQNQAFEKVIQAHHQKNNYPFPIIPENKNIDIMMETGTGKTFTFIQTMLELCKQFGYKKFIILIPTVPIREGTKTNLQDTKEYFKTIYANERENEIQTPELYLKKKSLPNSYLEVLKCSNPFVIMNELIDLTAKLLKDVLLVLTIIYCDLENYSISNKQSA